jgi:hypothetical protein
MKFTVFYAWQSDRPKKVNRFFVRDALQEAIDEIHSTASEVEDSPRPDEDAGAEPRLDHDTKDVPGLPEVARTILNKIDTCGIFVADVTFVGEAAPALDRPVKRLSNPNVLIELGYALARIGPERIICVMNEAFGPPSDLPFDLIHRRHPISYTLATTEDKPALKVERAKLRDAIEAAIRAIMQESPLRRGDAKQRRRIANISDEPAEAVPQVAADLRSQLPASFRGEFIFCGGDLSARGVQLVLKDAGMEAVAQTAEEESAIARVARAHRDMKSSAHALEEYVFGRVHPKGTQVAMQYSSVIAGVVMRMAVGFSDEDAVGWTAATSFRPAQPGCRAALDAMKDEEEFKTLLATAMRDSEACSEAMQALRAIETLR